MVCFPALHEQGLSCPLQGQPQPARTGTGFGGKSVSPSFWCRERASHTLDVWTVVPSELPAEGTARHCFMEVTPYTNSLAL